MSTLQPAWIQELLNSYATDAAAQQLLTELAVHSPNNQGFTLDRGLIRFKGKLWVANNSAMQTKIIAAFHSSTIGGHSGVQAILE